MFSRIMHRVGIAFGCLLALLLILVVVAMQFSTVTSVSTLGSGRTVTVESGWRGFGVSDSFDSATINMSGHTIVVAPTQIAVDGQALATIDPGVRTVEVTSQNGEITFTADKETVVRF